MKKILLIALLICALISLVGVDVVYAVKPTKTPKPTKKPKPSKTPNPNKPTPPPTTTPVPTDTPTPEPQAIPLFNMQLFINDTSPLGWLPYCIIKANGGVSVELQQLYCGWVATSHICGAPVMSDDTWACDSYGYYRQPLSRLLGE